MKQRIALLRSVFALFILLFVASVQAQIIKPETYYWSDKPDQTPVDPQFADASAVVLKDVRIYNFFYDKSRDGELQAYTITHKVIQINDTRAIESYNKIYIPLGGVIDIADIKARTVSASGKITELNKGNIKEISNKEGEGSYKIFAVEGLEQGSRLEYYFKLKKVVDYSFRISIGGTVPVQFHQLHVICPENLTYEHKTYNGTSADVDTVIDEKRYAIVTSKSVKGIDEEKYSDYTNELMRIEVQLAYNSYVGKGRVLTYNSVVQRMYPSYYEIDEKAMKKVQKISDQLGLSKLDTELKIRTIDNYVKTNIQEVKYSGDQFTDIGKILQDKIANNTGVIRLYHHFLQQAGIPMQVVYTTDRSNVAFDPDFESWNYLDDIIIYIPETDKFIDPSNVTLRYPMISTVYQLNHGLFMEELVVGDFKSATASIKSIPSDDPSQNSDYQISKCRFNKDMDSIYIDQMRRYGGIFAPSLKFAYQYYQPDERKKFVEEQLKFSMEDAKVITSEFKNSDMLNLKDPVEITGEIGGTMLVEKTGKDVIFKIGDIIGPQVELYQEKQRELNIDIYFGHFYDRNIQLVVPDGYKLRGQDALNMNIVFKYEGKDACGFVSTYTLEGNLLTVKVREYYNTIKLPKSVFEEFRKVINAAADFNKINLVLEKI